jgi:hypothetical protein
VVLGQHDDTGVEEVFLRVVRQNCLSSKYNKSPGSFTSEAHWFGS